MISCVGTRIGDGKRRRYRDRRAAAITTATTYTRAFRGNVQNKAPIPCLRGVPPCSPAECPVWNVLGQRTLFYPTSESRGERPSSRASAPESPSRLPFFVSGDHHWAPAPAAAAIAATRQATTKRRYANQPIRLMTPPRTTILLPGLNTRYQYNGPGGRHRLRVGGILVKVWETICRRVIQHVPEAPHCPDVPRSVLVRFDLVAQVANVDLHDLLGLPLVVRRILDLSQEIDRADHSPCVPGENTEDAELGRRQVNRLAISTDLDPPQVNDQIADRDRLPRLSRALTAPPKEGINPGKEHPDAKRLGKVVIGAELEAVQDVVLLGQRG